jgi:hypothetical protein
MDQPSIYPGYIISIFKATRLNQAREKIRRSGEQDFEAAADMVQCSVIVFNKEYTLK